MLFYSVFGWSKHKLLLNLNCCSCHCINAAADEDVGPRNGEPVNCCHLLVKRPARKVSGDREAADCFSKTHLWGPVYAYICEFSGEEVEMLNFLMKYFSLLALK